MAAKATTSTDAALRTEHDVTSPTPGTDEPLTTAAEQLARDLDAMTRLHRLSTRFVRAGDLPQVVLEEIVDVAIAITHADMGNIQLFDPASRRLTVAAHRGHEKWWLDFFESVAEGKGASCGAALELGTRAVVEDVTKSPIFVGTPALEVQLRAGVRAVQSTPLYGSSGDLVGMISTHFRTPHRPDERDLRFLDVLARQAADMIERVRSEATLRQGEARFRALVQASSDVVYRMSPDWSEMRELRGREFPADTPAPLRGRKFIADSPVPTRFWLDQYIHPDDKPLVTAAIAEAIRTRSTFELEHRVRRVDGSLGWSFSRAVPILGASGDVVEWFGTASDITARKQAETALRESEQLFRLLVQGVKDYAIYMIAPDGKVESWSSAAEHIFGFHEEEIVGQHRAIFYPEDDRRAGAAQGDLEKAAEEGLYEHEGWRLRKDGSRFWANVMLTAFRDDRGGIRGFASITRDVTERRRAESLLRESEGKYVAIHDRAPFGIALTKLPEGTFVTANDALLRMFGFSREEVIGKTSAELGISDADSQAVVRRELERSGALRGFEVTRRTRSGARIDITVNVEPVTIGGSEFLLTSILDITARKRAEEELRASEERLRLAQQIARVATFEWDIETGVNTWTPEMEALYGLPPGGFAGTEAAFQQHVHPEDRDQVLRWVELAMGTGAPGEGEWRAVWPDGSVHWIAARWQVLRGPSGKPVRMTGINMDVTDRKRADELRASEAVLREADRQRTQFLGMLSHELRNPLAPIRNSLYLLDHTEPTGQEAQRARDVLNRQVRHLTRLVDDLLDVTRITRGKIQLRRAELDLAALVRRTADDYRRMMRDRGLDLAVEMGGGGLVVNGDETRLAQVFGNLLSNAAKFTLAGGRVTIAARAEDGRAVVRVRDTGPGIAPDVIPSIFEPFTQASQTLARAEGGLGLGLALVRGLVSLHDGEVNVVSGSAGTEFIVTIPLFVSWDPQAAAPEPPARVKAPTSHRRVLVVDDNEDAAETLAEMVRMLGHGVEVAYDGRSAVRRAGEYRPDVVLCDIGLPGMDGYAVAHELRASHGRDIRLVAISGYAQPDDVRRAAEAGFDEHVAKPCGPEQIERLLS